jgi:hypothetical protein
MQLDNVTKKSENPKRQSCHNIREVNVQVDNVVTVNIKKTFRIMEIRLHSFLTSIQEQRGLTSHPGRFNFEDSDPGITDYEVGLGFVIDFCQPFILNLKSDYSVTQIIIEHK